MGFLKRLFGLEKTKEEPIINSELPKPIIGQPTPPREFIDDKCDLCNEVIGQDRRKKLGGKLYHRSCYKEQYKKMKAQGKVF